MKNQHHNSNVSVLQMGAGLIGRPLALQVASLSGVGDARVVDCDTLTRVQALRPSETGRPKAEVAAEMMRAANPRLRASSIVGRVEDLPLGSCRCRILLTALDSKRARIVANYAFRKLGIPFWVDSGISAPSLARVSVFAQGEDAPCYECGLSDADYASEASYPCQSDFTPPATNSPAYLGTLAASLQAAVCAHLLAGQFDPAVLNRELVYDVAAQKLYLTRLVRRGTCRLDHDPFKIRALRRGAGQITLAEAFAMGAGGPRAKTQAGASLEVPGKLFVRVLSCECGAERSVLRLKGRFGAAAQTCPRCGRRMSALGTGLANVLHREALSARDLAKPLSAFGLLPADVFAIGDGRRANFYELGHA